MIIIPPYFMAYFGTEQVYSLFQDCWFADDLLSSIIDIVNKLRITQILLHASHKYSLLNNIYGMVQWSDLLLQVFCKSEYAIGLILLSNPYVGLTWLDKFLIVFLEFRFIVAESYNLKMISEFDFSPHVGSLQISRSVATGFCKSICSALWYVEILDYGFLFFQFPMHKYSRALIL